MVVRKVLAILKYRKLIITSILGASGYNYVHNHSIYTYADQIKKFKDKNFAHMEFIANKFLASINDNVNKSKSWMDWFLAYEPMQLGYQQDAALVTTYHNYKTGVVMENQYQEDIFDYLKKIETLEKENKDLRKQLLIKNKGFKGRTFEPTLIDLYSEILDGLSSMEESTNEFQMPRIVVVGDQSSGKTSVLEMIAQSHIFPRGSGEMMTRSPVKVTLSQGPHHVAQFNDDSRLYDLTKEKDLKTLRKEIELRMIRGLNKDTSVSHDVISLTVKGPGLPRMVLVDLPGIISTVTNDMAPDTRDRITRLVKTYMSNPNSIVMCIQDGSIDAERSNVTDLVSGVDPTGQRTIFVLTKVDLAEKNSLVNPDRLRKILEGKLFPMKALGYYAVVTGTGDVDDSIDTIKTYEEDFFRNSKLTKGGVLRANQVTTTNMSLAVSRLFWKMVRDSVEQQCDEIKARRFNLETEWKNSFPKARELDREELFERGKNRILDDMSRLSTDSTPKQWEDQLLHVLWHKINRDIMDNIYLKGQIKKLRILQPTGANQSSSNDTHIILDTALDIALKKWSEAVLPSRTIEAGWETIKTNLGKYFETGSGEAGNSEADPHHRSTLYKTFREAVLSQTINNHEWNEHALQSLRNLQSNVLFDPQPIQDKSQWEQAVKFAERAIQDSLAHIETNLRVFENPGWFRRWFLGSSSNILPKPEESSPFKLDKLSPEFTRKVVPAFEEEFSRILKFHLSRPATYSSKMSVTAGGSIDVATLIEQAKTNLLVRGGFDMVILGGGDDGQEPASPLQTEFESVLRDVAGNLYEREIFRLSLQNLKECRKAYAYFDQITTSSQLPNSSYAAENDAASKHDKSNRREIKPTKISNIRCDDIVFFWRIYTMLQATSRALRQQINGSELRTLNSEIRQILEEFGSDPNTLQNLFTGRQVTLAEELKKIRSIQAKLDMFIQKLAKEKH